MKKIVLLGLLISASLMGKEIRDPENIEIGITQIIEHPALDSARRGFEKSLKENGYEKAHVEYQNAQGDFATAQLIGQGFVQKKKDLIFAISTPSAQAAYNATNTIPIVITAVTDPQAAGLVGKNITGTSDMMPVSEQLKVVKDILPKVKKIGVLYNTSEQNSQIQVKTAKEEGIKLGFEIVETGVSSIGDIASGIDNILGKVDALYIPTDNLVVSATPLVIDRAKRAGKPVIGCIEDQVKQGALVTKTIDYKKLGYQTGEMAIKILRGEKPENMPVETLRDMQLIVNKKMAEKYGVNLESETLKDAKIY
ncbi:ABC transporter substrate-binding protein [Fusobacterium sp.]|uniref:ABC transporter substrate-binding protein n=1 Tax=Fusobacterium sp. TaxID=68766 RepID=UPI00396C9255